VIEAMSEKLSAQVYITVTERPGATISQIATRIGETPRRVRHQIERMVATGIVIVDSETTRRNARERHYRAVAWARVLEELDRSLDDEERRKFAHSVVRMIVTDLGRAARGRIFGSHAGHAQVRIPGEVDEEGREELAAIMEQTMKEIEASMIRSAARLEASGKAGTEVISALLLFEGQPWEAPGASRDGPRPAQWCADELAKLS
jgi:DNA-binding transcriptional ArsR family regulator